MEILNNKAFINDILMGIKLTEINRDDDTQEIRKTNQDPNIFTQATN